MEKKRQVVLLYKYLPGVFNASQQSTDFPIIGLAVTSILDQSIKHSPTWATTSLFVNLLSRQSAMPTSSIHLARHHRSKAAG
jgi:hypothetical protein